MAASENNNFQEGRQKRGGIFYKHTVEGDSDDQGGKERYSRNNREPKTSRLAPTTNPRMKPYFALIEEGTFEQGILSR